MAQFFHCFNDSIDAHLNLKGFSQKERISLFWWILVNFLRILLNLYIWTCFDVKNVVL